MRPPGLPEEPADKLEPGSAKCQVHCPPSTSALPLSFQSRTSWDLQGALSRGSSGTSCRAPHTPRGRHPRDTLSRSCLALELPCSGTALGSSSKGSVVLLYFYSQHPVQAWPPGDVPEVKNELSLPIHLPFFFPFFLPLPPGHPPAWSWKGSELSKDFTHFLFSSFLFGSL